MGRDAKRKKQARRDQRERQKRRIGRPRLPEGERFSSVGQAVKDGIISSRTEAAPRSTVGFLARTYSALQQQDPAGPACGGPLLVHVDGAFQCTAGCPGGIKVVHAPKALHFCDYADQLGITADELDHICPACTAAGAADPPGRAPPVHRHRDQPPRPHHHMQRRERMPGRGHAPCVWAELRPL
ncbi:hypothetical protein FBY34_8826 [Streptomyces sp. SLBN-115]|nr:hypothetical protein FBY34_8826 [Streptomyces sp. SLBN-115]